MPSKALLQAIAVTAELTNTELSAAAARVLADDLARYPEAQVLGALVRCRKELKGRMSPADIITRLADGRPGAEEAWAMIPRDEMGSVVWTEEMREAYGVAAPLIAENEPITARMAFLERYRALVQAARDAGVPVRWTASLGYDTRGRERVLLEAVEQGKLPREHAMMLLPNRDTAATEKLATPLLEDRSKPSPARAKFVAESLAMLTKKAMPPLEQKDAA